MKLLLVTADPVIQEAVKKESQAQNWSSEIVDDRNLVVDLVRTFKPGHDDGRCRGDSRTRLVGRKGLTDLKPTLFMHSEVNEEFLTRSFEVGADGFIPKSVFSRRYLVARVKAYIRRQNLADARRLIPRLGLVLDSQRYRVEVRGKTFH